MVDPSRRFNDVTNSLPTQRPLLYNPCMPATKILTVALAATLTAMAYAAPLPVIVKGSEAHIAAAALEREAGIVIKKLPEGGGFVACGAQQCAPLRSVLNDGITLLVPVTALSEALNLTADFDENRRHVSLVAAPRNNSSTAGVAQVGSITPNLRLTKLDGTAVTLDELRGQRVLINSWASW